MSDFRLMAKRGAMLLAAGTILRLRIDVTLEFGQKLVPSPSAS